MKQKVTLKKNNKFFWAYITLGVLVIALSVFLLPVWKDKPWSDWGFKALALAEAVGLGYYLFAFLLGKIKHTNGKTLKILSIIEFTILFVIDVLLLFMFISTFIPDIDLPKLSVFGTVCSITGFALWARGVVEIFRAYFHQKGNEETYPMWWLCIAVAMVSVGMWFFIKPPFSDKIFVWVLVSCFIVLGILALSYGIYAIPANNKKQDNKDEKKQIEDAKEEKEEAEKEAEEAKKEAEEAKKEAEKAKKEAEKAEKEKKEAEKEAKEAKKEADSKKKNSKKSSK